MSQIKADNRYWTIDSLRGIAALAVALYHIDAFSLANVDGVLAPLFHKLFHFGYLGVSIFFVISGFVIAASTANGPITFGYFGKFILKRSVRLDPTYWTSIALDILLATLALRIFYINAPIPDPSKVVLHIFYLQDLTNVGNIASIYWTLCLEVQFYIVFCLVLAVDNYLSNKYSAGKSRPNFKAWLFAVITLYSMGVSAGLVTPPLNGLFVTHWTLFALGAAAYFGGVKNPNDRWLFPGFLLAVLCVFAIQVKDRGLTYAFSLALACSTALLLFIGAKADKLGTWLKNRVLLYLGSRSYSIYMFHTIVGERTAKLLMQVIYPKLGIPHTELFIFFAFITGIAISLATAEVVYRLVEVPSLQLSKRIRPSQPGVSFKKLAGSSAV